MADITRSGYARTVRVVTTPADRMTVWHLRDFVRALDAEGIPDGAEVECRHATDTWRTVGLSVSVNQRLEAPATDTTQQGTPDA